MTQIKELPILLSGDMVCAILDGRKSQIRLPVKAEIPDGFKPQLDWLHPNTEPTKQSYGFWLTDRAACVSPFGGPRDRLWIREAWRCTGGSDWKGIAYRAEEGQRSYQGPYQAAYKAMGLDAIGRLVLPKSLWPKWDYLVCETRACTGWRRSIHIPRWASRLNLEVTTVRVEQIQDIYEHDAQAEGVTKQLDFWNPETGNVISTHRGAFRHLWDSTYAKRGCGWSVNPFVWIATFKQFPEVNHDR